MSKIDGLIAQYCPDGVEFRALGDVAQVLNGYAFKSSKYSNKGIRVIRISDVQKGKISDKSLKFYPIETKKEIEKYLLTENDLVMSLTGDVGRVAMLSANDLPAGLNQRVACIRVNTKEILTRYLFHFFDQDAFENDAMSNATGGGQQNMSTRWLSSYPIPVPPLEVQEEIVKILDTFTELGAELAVELKARQQQYNHYRAVFLNFDDEMNIKPLSAIALYSNTRVESSSLDHDSYVGVDNLLQNRAGKTVSKYVPEIGRLTGYEKEDILIGNIRPYLKKIWHSDRQGGTNGDVLVIRIKPEEKENINPRYLYQILADDSFFYYAVETSKGAKMPRGNKPMIMKYKIPVPPLKEQERIVAILDKFDTLVNDISNGLPAEINLRRQQYQHYRHKLLTFKKT